jgi:hypothetical protein
LQLVAAELLSIEASPNPTSSIRHSPDDASATKW